MTYHENSFIVSRKTLADGNKRDTNNPIKIVWDELKRQQNLAKHGMDFADLDPEFFESAVVLPAAQGRFMAINVLINGIVTVVFARLGSEGISIISMRRASMKERKAL